jgi:predicted transcriptional regulator
MAKVTELENTIQMLERDNKALDSSNGVLVIDNTLFHDKIRQMTRQIKQVVHQAERLQQ